MKEDEYQQQLHFILSRIKEERVKANMSQIELSFAAGLSQNQVNCIETGRNIPNLYTLLKICGALNIRPAALFTTHTDTERDEAKNQIIALVRKYL
ncbi:MAG: helix-turn-helix transcriptional regulator [Spirochaetaceae bacterium]|nr:helix-turn-helix transcriptional regulator [Spirochaetaceae bacterium]